MSGCSTYLQNKINDHINGDPSAQHADVARVESTGDGWRYSNRSGR